MGASTCKPMYTSRLDTGFTGYMLHFFSLAYGVVSKTMLSFKEFFYLVVVDVSRIKGAFVMVLDKHQLAYLESDALVIFLSAWVLPSYFLLGVLA